LLPVEVLLLLLLLVVVLLLLVVVLLLLVVVLLVVSLVSLVSLHVLASSVAGMVDLKKYS
jgi:hypothetical protein